MYFIHRMCKVFTIYMNSLHELKLAFPLWLILKLLIVNAFLYFYD